MWWRKALLTVHIAASVSVAGAAAVLTALGVSGARGAAAPTVYPAAHLIEARIVAPLALAALVTGVAQALLGKWGLFRHWWITVKLAVTAGATVVVFTVLEPALAALSHAATATSPITSQDRLRLAIVPAVALTLLLFNTALGVYKPGAKRGNNSRHKAVVAGRPVSA